MGATDRGSPGREPAEEPAPDETDSPESPSPLPETEPVTPSDPPAVEPEALAERALDQIRAAYPEFMAEAPELVDRMARDVFGTFDKELREKLNEYAYRRLGRVPPQQ